MYCFVLQFYLNEHLTNSRKRTEDVPEWVSTFLTFVSWVKQLDKNLYHKHLEGPHIKTSKMIELTYHWTVSTFSHSRSSLAFCVGVFRCVQKLQL